MADRYAPDWAFVSAEGTSFIYLRYIPQLNGLIITGRYELFTVWTENYVADRSFVTLKNSAFFIRICICIPYFDLSVITSPRTSVG